MSKNVAIRRMDVYQTDDARRIEVWKKVSNTNFDPLSNGELEEDSNDEGPEEEEIFIGVIQLEFSGLGLKEVRFKIDGANSIESAFENFTERAKEVAEEAENKFEQFIAEKQQQQQRIIPASASALRQLDNPEHGVIDIEI